MKKMFSLILIGAAASVLQACSGDHTPTGGQDSVKDIPGYDAGAKVIDTSRVTTQLGSATMLENAGSGGSRIVKDTSKHSFYAGKPATAAAAPAPVDTAKAGKDSTAKK
ncbi:hypothetical protein [Mucilaginibacter koreensis]